MKSSALYLTAIIVFFFQLSIAQTNLNKNNSNPSNAPKESTPIFKNDFDFYDFTQLVQQSCGNFSVSDEKKCKNNITIKVVYDKGLKLISSDFFRLLLKISVDQASIWADTILEGDFEAKGDTQVSKISAIIKDGHLMAYRVTYKETAWYTGDPSCRFEYNNYDSFQNCEQGYISESTYVSADLASIYRDENHVADFNN